MKKLKKKKKKLEDTNKNKTIAELEKAELEKEKTNFLACSVDHVNDGKNCENLEIKMKPSFTIIF